VVVNTNTKPERRTIFMMSKPLPDEAHDISKTIGKNIGQLRAKLNLTQSELGAKIGLSGGQICNIENIRGKNKNTAGYNLRTLCAVARALNSRLVIKFVPIEDKRPAVIVKTRPVAATISCGTSAPGTENLAFTPVPEPKSVPRPEPAPTPAPTPAEKVVFRTVYRPAPVTKTTWESWARRWYMHKNWIVSAIGCAILNKIQAENGRKMKETLEQGKGLRAR
jgi:transcriptional regulator with XRE-family HTH domain